ncbi:3-hydroxyanthranilate 3,4-dioxygenase, partial [Reticulomyxa filosa]
KKKKRLMYGNQLKVMYVGGPNTRRDYHIECGEEFLYQMKGTMHLPIVEQGKHRNVEIKEGYIFLIPKRMPHSPQRPEKGSVGLVVERYRHDQELDALRWYSQKTGKESEVLFERWFRCNDLGVDLVPIAKVYYYYFFFFFLKKKGNFLFFYPFNLHEFIQRHSKELAKNKTINVLTGEETTVRIITGISFCLLGETEIRETPPVDLWVYVLKGTAGISFEKDSKGSAREKQVLQQSDCLIVQPKQSYVLFVKDETAQVMTVSMKPTP